MKNLIIAFLFLFLLSPLSFAEETADYLAKVDPANLLRESSLPIKITPIDPFLAEKMQLESTSGVYVSLSDCEKIKKEDLIYKVNGISVKNPQEFVSAVKGLKIGTTATLEVFGSSGWGSKENKMIEIETVESKGSQIVELSASASQFHKPGSGHTYGQETICMSRQYAEKSNYIPCRICFPEIEHLSETEKKLTEMGRTYTSEKFTVYPQSDLRTEAEKEKMKMIIKTYDKLAGICRITPRKDNLTLLNTPDFNTFIIADGTLYMTKGLFDVLDTEEEVAGLLSHELSHYSERHQIKQYEAGQNANTVGTIVGLALLGSSGFRGNTKLTELSVGFFSNLFSSGYSREIEKEADIAGLSYMSSAGYDPKGVIRVMMKLKTLDEQHPDYSIFKSHPSPADRIEVLKEKLNLWEEKKLMI